MFRLPNLNFFGRNQFLNLKKSYSTIKNPYAVLGINSKASAKEIKNAYRNLAKEYHPDVNTAANAKQKFIEVNEAYEALTKKPSHSSDEIIWDIKKKHGSFDKDEREFFYGADAFYNRYASNFNRRKDVDDSDEDNYNGFSSWEKPQVREFEDRLRKICDANNISLQSIIITYVNQNNYRINVPLNSKAEESAMINILKKAGLHFDVYKSRRYDGSDIILNDSFDVAISALTIDRLDNETSKRLR